MTPPQVITARNRSCAGPSAVPNTGQGPWERPLPARTVEVSEEVHDEGAETRPAHGVRRDRPRQPRALGAQHPALALAARRQVHPPDGRPDPPAAGHGPGRARHAAVVRRRTASPAGRARGPRLAHRRAPPAQPRRPGPPRRHRGDAQDTVHRGHHARRRHFTPAHRPAPLLVVAGAGRAPGPHGHTCREGRRAARPSEQRHHPEAAHPRDRPGGKPPAGRRRLHRGACRMDRPPSTTTGQRACALRPPSPPPVPRPELRCAVRCGHRCPVRPPGRRRVRHRAIRCPG